MLLKRFLLIFALCCLGLTAVWSTTRSLTAAPANETALLNVPPTSWSHNGISPSGEGTSVAVGDINGDGVNDLIIGEPNFDGGGGTITDSGRILIFTSTGSTITPAPFTIQPPTPTVGAKFGYAITLGDFDGDLIKNIVVGAPGYSNGQINEGAVFVYTSDDLLFTPGVIAVLESNEADARFGFSVAAVSTIDTIGSDELLIGAPYQGLGGRAYFYQTVGPDFTPLWTADGPANSYFGHSVSSSDFANDGDADLIIGAPMASPVHQHEGAVYLFNIVSDIVSPVPNITLTGNRPDAEFGYAVLGGPTDANGLGSVLIGAPGFRDGTALATGKAFMYKTPFTIPVWSANGQTLNGRFGSALAIGDFDYTDTQDIFVGDKLYGPTNMPEQGAVYIYLQTDSSSFNPNYDWKLFGENSGDNFGSSIATGNILFAFPSDGVLVGAPNWNNGFGQATFFHARSDSSSPNLFPTSSPMYVPAGVPFNYQTLLSGSAFVLLEWSMGNGEAYVTYIENPGSGFISTITHTYHSPGIYTATVLALVPNNQFSSVQQTFVVHVIDPVSNILFTNNSPVRFSALTNQATVNFRLAADSSTPITYEVNYGDDIQDIFVQPNGAPLSFSHTYTAPGYYRAEVHANDGIQITSKVARVRVVRFLPLGPSSGGTITHTWSNNRPFIVDVPNGTVPLTDVELLFNPVGDATFSTPFPEDGNGFMVRGPIPTPLNNPVFFDIEVARDLDLQCTFLPIITVEGSTGPTGIGVQSPCVQDISGTFETPVEYTFKYNLEDLPDDTTPEDLRFFFFDEANGIWVDGADTCSGGSIYVVDTINQTITLPICHQSRWGVGF